MEQPKSSWRKYLEAWELLFCSKYHNGGLGDGTSESTSLPLSQDAAESEGLSLVILRTTLLP